MLHVARGDTGRAIGPIVRAPTLEDMTILRMDNVGIVFDDLDAAVAFFVELGLELEGKMTVEGEWSDRIVGLDGQRVDVAMMRTPDGHSKLELMSYHKPTMISPEPKMTHGTFTAPRSAMRFDFDSWPATIGFSFVECSTRRSSLVQISFS